MTKRLIDYGTGRNTTMIGTTRHGKTYGAIQSLTKAPKGVLFINTQQEKFPRGWTRASMRNDSSIIIDEVRQGTKINYEPDRRYREQELKLIIDDLFTAARDTELDMYLVIDEAHLYRKEGLRAAEEQATTGLRWGIQGIYITQRPQLLSKTLWSQSTFFVFYKTYNLQESYFQSYGIPYAAMNERIPGKYAYSTFDGENVEGAFTV